MRTLHVDGRVTGDRSRLHPIGSTGNTVFLKVSRESSVEIWSLNTLFPDSWKRLFAVDLIEVYYTYAAFSTDGRRIYLLVFGTSKSNEDEVTLYEINHRNKEFTTYALDATYAAEFYSLPFETAYFSHGKAGLHIYDRGIIMGDIPYWNIELQEASFSIRRADIEDHQQLKSVRYPIAIDTGRRIFARLLSDNRLVLSSPDTNTWEEYIQSAESHFNLCDFESRGISETFSRGGGHRMGAIMTPLTFYSDGTTVIAKVHRWKIYHFYRIIFNHERREFTCIPAGSARFTGGLDQMFYGMVTSTTFIAVGVRAIGVVQLKPPSMAECALWALQKRQLKTVEVGVKKGGYSFDCLQKYFGTALMTPFRL